jgi:hypothetical protein
MSSVCASTQSEGENEGTKKLYTYTSSVPSLFMGPDEAPVTFTYNQLVVNNAAEENLLYSVLLECPYRSSVQKMYPDHEITLFGITVGDLRYCEGEEGWPQTLSKKMINKDNDRQFDISDISDGAITIDHHFREKFKDGEWTDDARANALYMLLNRLGIMHVLNSLSEKEFSYVIPKSILMGEDLRYGSINSKEEKKLQHLFGIDLEETKWAQRLKELLPDSELPEFSSKKEMKAFFFNKYAQILKDKDSQKEEKAKLEEKLKESAQVHENMEKEISKKDEKIKEVQSLYEHSVASVEQMYAQNLKAQEEIAGFHQTRQKDQEEMERLRQMKESLESSLTQLKEKTSKFFENMHILMNDFSK